MAIPRHAKWSHWPWLLLPLSASSAGWITVPYFYSARAFDLEGAYYIAWFVGILSMALTAPLSIIAIDQLRWTPKISGLWYFGVLLALAAPSFAFQTFAISASVMELFTGSALLFKGHVLIRLEFGLVFIILYAVIGFVTYPFVETTRLRAVAAAGLVGAFLFGFMLMRAFGIVRY